MLKELKQVEKVLPYLLRTNKWESLNINYHEPYVERVWSSVQLEHMQVRVLIHHILPCAEEEPLFHPHPWPSAMKILQGKYEMGIGVQAADQASTPKVSTRLIGGPGTYYEMTDPNAWHYVKPTTPLGTYTIMVTGKPWDEDLCRLNPNPPQKPLEPLQEDRMFTLLTRYLAWAERVAQIEKTWKARVEDSDAYAPRDR